TVAAEAVSELFPKDWTGPPDVVCFDGLHSIHHPCSPRSQRSLRSHGIARKAWTSPVVVTPQPMISPVSLIDDAASSCTNGEGARTKSLRSFGSLRCHMRARPP